MKVLYITSTLKRSGPTNQLYSLIKNIQIDPCDIFVLTLSSEGMDSRWDDFSSLNINLASLNLSRGLGFFTINRKLEKIIKEFNPSIIHSSGFRADYHLSLLNINSEIKKITTIHNYPQLDYRATYGRLSGYVISKIHINSFKNFHKCIGCSESVSNNLKTLLPKKIFNIHYVRNGVDANDFVSNKVSNVEIRKILGISKDKKVWIYVGHLSVRKNPLLIIKFWLKNNIKDYLIILGDGPLLSECKALANKYIYILGRRNDVSNYLNASDYFISSSTAEGLPMAVLEAMSHGLPLLLSDIEPHKEIVNLSNFVGYCFSLKNIDDLHDKYNKMTESPYPLLKINVKDLMNRELSAKRMADSYFEMYQN